MLTDDQVALLLEADYGREPDTRLLTSPDAEALPAQTWIVQSTIAECRDMGLQLPTLINIRFVAASSDAQYGMADGRNGQFTIHVKHELVPAELRRVLRHEAQHISDMHTGEWDRCSRVERERRAIRFSATLIPQPITTTSSSQAIEQRIERIEQPFTWPATARVEERIGHVRRSTATNWTRIQEANGRTYVAFREQCEERQLPRHRACVRFIPGERRGVAIATRVRGMCLRGPE